VQPQLHVLYCRPGFVDENGIFAAKANFPCCMMIEWVHALHVQTDQTSHCSGLMNRFFYGLHVYTDICSSCKQRPIPSTLLLHIQHACTCPSIWGLQQINAFLCVCIPTKKCVCTQHMSKRSQAVNYASQTCENEEVLIMYARLCVCMHTRCCVCMHARTHVCAHISIRCHRRVCVHTVTYVYAYA
jgi:hypothetical protein